MTGYSGQTQISSTEHDAIKLSSKPGPALTLIDLSVQVLIQPSTRKLESGQPMGCFCFGEEGPKVQVGSKGEEIYRYPSGNVAAVIQGGTLSSFYEDSNRGRVLCCFTSQGDGKIYYETGQVRRVSSPMCRLFTTFS